MHCAITWVAWSESQSLNAGLPVSRKVPHVEFLKCLTFDPCHLMILQRGGVTEWPNVPVLKTDDPPEAIADFRAIPAIPPHRR